MADGSPLNLGATHGAEIASLFAHPEGISAIDIEQTDETRELSDRIQAAWTSFARNGEPGENFAPFSDGGAVTVIDVPFEQVDQIRAGRCSEISELTG